MLKNRKKDYLDLAKCCVNEESKKKKKEATYYNILSQI